jgi:pilus assembly protein Flp/PilA
MGLKAQQRRLGIATMKVLLARFAQDESGVTGIEYGLIGGLVAIVIITAAATIGTGIQVIFTTIATALLVP